MLLPTIRLNFPVLQKIHEQILIRFVQRHVVQKTESMTYAHFVHMFPDRHSAVFLGLANMLEQKRMVSFFDT